MDSLLDVLLIVPQNIKNKTIKEINKKSLNNTKVTTFEEIKNNLYFTYDEKTIHYIMKNYKVNYNLSKTYLDNLYLINDETYNSEKLNKLVGIKRKLEEEQLLIKNNLYKSFLKSKKVIILGYDKFNLFQTKIINDIKKITNIEIKKQDLYDIKKCYEFDSMLNEIIYVFEQISFLIDKEIDINKISILNVNDDYINTIKFVSEMYNLPINLDSNNYLFGTKTCSKFLSKLKETNNIKESLSSINDSSLYNQFVDVCNKYVWCVDEYLYELIENELKNTKITIEKYMNAISINEKKEYNFLIGFNNNFPLVLKDDDYLSDNLKKQLGFDTSYELNEINKIQTIYELKTTEHLTLSYSLTSITDEYFKSSIVDELNIEIKKIDDFISLYSDKINKLNLLKYLDLYTKYGHVNKNLLSLNNKYKVKYLSYNNQFKGINKNDLLNSLNNNLTLSYTSLNNYYNCNFKYYLNDLLKLNINDDLFHLTIGNLYHYILSVAFKPDFNFEKSVDEYINSLNKQFSPKEKFFLKKLTINLKEIIEIIKNQKKYTSLNDELYEKKIYIDKSKQVKITFMGIVDKILYKKENEKMYAVVIDYKTGNPNTSLDNIKYGIDMQLPIYLYLIQKEYNNVEVIGLYYQKLLHKLPNIKDKEDINSNYKLIGYSIDKEDLIKKIDSTYEDSLLIKGMKKGRNGFYAYTKLLNEEDIKNMFDLVDDKINNAIDNILDGNFKINPKRIDKYCSCDNCIYSDICYKKEEDYIYLNED